MTPLATFYRHFNRDHFCQMTDADGEIQAGVIDIYLASGTKMAERIEAAAGRGDSAEMAAAAHSCRGGVGVFGAEALVKLLERVELAATRGDLGQATAEVAFIKPWLEQLMHELAGYRAGLNAA